MLGLTVYLKVQYPDLVETQNTWFRLERYVLLETLQHGVILLHLALYAIQLRLLLVLRFLKILMARIGWLTHLGTIQVHGITVGV